jgi:hypothetical protein
MENGETLIIRTNSHLQCQQLILLLDSNKPLTKNRVLDAFASIQSKKITRLHSVVYSILDDRKSGGEEMPALRLPLKIGKSSYIVQTYVDIGQKVIQCFRLKN